MSEKSKAMAARADQQCSYTDWRTPEAVLDAVRESFGGQIYLDPATNAQNTTKAILALTGGGLTFDWAGRGWRGTFVNPPYGRGLPKWVHKIGQEASRGCRILALLPSNRLDTVYLHAALFRPELDALVVFRRRLAFLDGEGKPAPNNTQGSIMYSFGVSASALRRAFNRAGVPCSVMRVGVMP